MRFDIESYDEVAACVEELANALEMAPQINAKLVLDDVGGTIILDNIFAPSMASSLRILLDYGRSLKGYIDISQAMKS